MARQVRRAANPWWLWPLVGLMILGMIAAGITALIDIGHQADQSAQALKRSVPAKPSAAASTARPWNIIGSWSGKATKNTRSFSVRSPWRIRWSCRPDPQFGVGIFAIQVCRPGERLPVQLVANIANQPGADLSYVYESGQFYLDISATMPWKIVVEGQQ